MSRPALRTRCLVFAFCIALFTFGPSEAFAQETPPGGLALLRDTDASRIIVFVHGFTGNSEETWLHDRTESYWPRLIGDDPAFADADIAVYGYPSSLFEDTFSIDEIADNLRLHMDNRGISKAYDEVVFIAHSMGGLVVRAFMLKYRDSVSVPLIYFLATPTNGADLANIAGLLSSNRQIEGLKSLEENQVLQSQSSSWLASPFQERTRSYCAYETKDTLGVRVVPRASATALCNQSPDPIGENHERIAKPADAHSDAYIAFKVAYGETFQKLELVRGGADLTLGPGEQGDTGERVIIADQLQVTGEVEVSDGTVIVANDVVLEGATLRGTRLSIVAASINGGAIDVSGSEGENGGELLIAAGRVVGTRMLAKGGAGKPGIDGTDGTDGAPGAHGQNGDCRPFGAWEAAHTGGNGGSGTDGVDGTDGGNGSSGGLVFLVTLNKVLAQPDVGGGERGDGGRGGRAGKGGPGGRGGAGCTGLGGSQSSRSGGASGRDGLDGRDGTNGVRGSDGIVWAQQVESFGDIAAIVPLPKEIPDYADDIVKHLKLIAQGAN